MKKVLSFILLLVYFVVSTGFTVNLHYCMNRYHSWELGGKASDKCSTCGMDTSDSKGCCRDEVKVVKLQQDLALAKSVGPLFSLPVLVTYVSAHLVAPFQNSDPYILPHPSPPPLLSEQQTYLENGVLRL